MIRYQADFAGAPGRPLVSGFARPLTYLAACQVLLACLLLACLLLASVASAQATARPSDVAASRTIPVDVPLRVEVTHTVNLKVGQPFHGRLIEPVYGADRLLLPADSRADGVVSATPATDRHTRINAKFDGDFTPLRVPVIRITQVVLPSGVVLPLDAEGGLRDAATIHLGQRPVHMSIAARVKGLVHQQLQQVHDTIHDPHKGDRVRQLLYRQLPYHPQRMWAGSDFDAVLTQPLLLPDTAAGPALPRAKSVELSSGNMQARLTAGISSASAQKGDPVTAVLTHPFLNPKGEVMLPAGTPLHGLILQSSAARSFGRNGRLRFSFRSIVAPAAASAQHIDGNLTSIQGLAGQNVALDAEGGTRAQPDQGRFLAPLVLGVMAAASQDEDSGVLRQGVTSNGFGLPARILSMTLASRDASTGFAAFAFSKSIYRRFLARGHEVAFPKHTELAIELSRR